MTNGIQSLTAIGDKKKHAEQNTMTVTEQLRNIIEVTESKGTSRYQIAKGASVDYATLHRFMEGTRAYLRSDTIDRLAMYFGMELKGKKLRRKKIE